ncbi:MAG: ribonuclease H-like domain-containing protein [Phycisphaerae bacterium]
MKTRAYLDIETTGLSKYRCDITIIGIGIEKAGKVEVIQLIGRRICEYNLLKVLRGVNRIYTYNGSRFDLAFIKTKLAVDLKQNFIHTDLMYNCWKHNLKGGLKAVEKRLGIARKLTDMNGWIAVKLWWDYCNNNDLKALKKLLDYNAEDVVNLRTLRLKLLVD